MSRILVLCPLPYMRGYQKAQRYLHIERNVYQLTVVIKACEDVRWQNIARTLATGMARTEALLSERSCRRVVLRSMKLDRAAL